MFKTEPLTVAELIEKLQSLPAKYKSMPVTVPMRYDGNLFAVTDVIEFDDNVMLNRYPWKPVSPQDETTSRILHDHYKDLEARQAKDLDSNSVYLDDKLYDGCEKCEEIIKIL